jgi:cyclic-di-GMP phosphodiesterase TipF (flagellum assembly factor)
MSKKQANEQTGAIDLFEDGFKKPAGALAYVAIASCFICVGVSALLVSPSFAVTLFLVMVSFGMTLSGIAKRVEIERKNEETMSKLVSSYSRLVREVSRATAEISDVEEKVRKSFQSNIQAVSVTPPLKKKVVGQVVDAKKVANEVKPEDKPVVNDVAPLAAPVRNAAKTQKTPEIRGKEKAGDKASPKYSNAVVLELIKHGLEHNAVEAFIQPVVTLPQRKTAFYEMFARVRTSPGKHLAANDYMQVAEENSLSSEIDNMLLLECLKAVRQAEERVSISGAGGNAYFLNLTSDTIRDSAYMNNLLAFVKKHRGLASKLIFEFSQDDVLNMKETTRNLLGAIAKTGCRFSMDRVNKRITSVPLLKKTNISFVKLDASWIASMDSDRINLTSSKDLRGIKKSLDDAGISIIAEKVESERVLLEILDYGIGLGQGYLFGSPAPHGTFVRKRSRRAA